MSAFNQDVRATAALVRLRELVPKILKSAGTLHGVITGEIEGKPAASDDDRRMRGLVGKLSEFHAGSLKDEVTTARSYFHDLGLGTDAEELLQDAIKFEREWGQYWDDKRAGKEPGKLHNRALLLLLQQLKVEEATKQLWNTAQAVLQANNSVADRDTRSVDAAAPTTGKLNTEAAKGQSSDAFAELRTWATELRKGERKTVETLCEKAGYVSFADLALVLRWQGRTFDDKASSLYRRLNEKLKRGKQPWRVERFDNGFRLNATTPNRVVERTKQKPKRRQKVKPST